MFGSLMRYVFNPYNIFLLVIYSITCYVMNVGGSSSSFILNIGSLFFEITLLIIWGAIFSFEREYQKLSAFNYDLYVMTFAFVAALLIGLIFQEKNPDVLGWWPFFVIIGTFFGFLWSLIFAAFAALMDFHEKYTRNFSLFMMVALTLIQVSVSYRLMPEKYLYYFLSLTLVIHVTVCMYKHIYQKFNS